MTRQPSGLARQDNWFLALFALAWAGGSIAYVPFLTVLLPARVLDLAGAGAVDWLAYIAFTGAIVASLANIGFGWLSDITHNRRGFVAAGLVLSCTMLVLVGPMEQLPGLLAVIALWQLSLNMMLAPLVAWAGDCVPDHQKGQLGGLLSFAPAIGAMSGTFVTIPGLADNQMRLGLVAIIVVACVLPALLLARPKSFPELLRSPALRVAGDGALPPSPPVLPLTGPSRTVAGAATRMWLARMLVQVAEAALFAYLLLWLRSLSGTVSDNTVAWVYSLGLIVAAPVAIFAGRWADRHDRPLVPLAACAAGSAAGLLLMAVAWNLVAALAGYLLFGIAGTVFLSLHTAQTLRVLPRPETRGRDLGIFNLTNTVPSLIMPWITLALVPVFGFSGLFLLLAALAFTAFLILLSMRR